MIGRKVACTVIPPARSGIDESSRVDHSDPVCEGNFGRASALSPALVVDCLPVLVKARRILEMAYPGDDAWITEMLLYHLL